MANVIIVAEKPSAARAFGKALGGREGHLADGRSYQIVNLRGHLFEHQPPMRQPIPGSAQSAAKLGGKGIGEWVADPAANPGSLPWDHRAFVWLREPKADVAGELAQLRLATTAPDVVEIMCATDLDPSGEGGLLFEEVATELRWVGQTGHPSEPCVTITRAVFHDESANSLGRAVKDARNHVIASAMVSLYDWDEYRKAVARSRLDFLSQQYVQISTAACGNNTVLRQGRLKSAMLVLIADQQRAHDSYVKTVSHADQLIDENGVVYKHPHQDRRLVPDQNDPTLAARMAMLKAGEPWPVAEVSRVERHSVPPRLLDLSTLAGKLSHLAPAGTVAATYQRMYEAGIVSYPRTEDKHVTTEQFNALLVDSHRIAAAVGVDGKLLSHPSKRPTHVKDAGAHGANRPGPNVPGNMAELRAEYGDLGAAIYELVARSALAMLAEDYIYTQIAAQAGPPEPHGPYQAVVNIAPPQGSRKWGWKQIVGIDPKTDTRTQPGTSAKARLGQIVPKRPGVPTVAWLMASLTKRDIGTGSTRVSTLGAVARQSSPKAPALVKDSKGRLTLTEAGRTAVTVIRDTVLGDLGTTKRIQDQLTALTKGGDLDAFLDQMAGWVLADAPKILSAAKNAGLSAPSDRHAGQWIDPDTGKTHQASFPKQTFGLTITDEQARRLLAGEAIAWDGAKSKTGGVYAVQMRLGHRQYNNHSFIGLNVVERGKGLDAGGQIIPFAARDTSGYIKGVWNGQRVEVKPVIAKVDLGDGAACQNATGMSAKEVAARLLAGGQVLVRGLMKANGASFDANVQIGPCEYKGVKYVGLTFGARPASTGKAA
jgi:DNA topoisomerase-3